MSSRILTASAGLLILLAATLLPAEEPKPGKEKVQFNRDIRPIFSDTCFACHGPDKNKRKAKLRLDERESALAKKAIVPGKPEESGLMARLFSEDETEMMPPPETHKKLTDRQKNLIKQWIAEGAEYQAHWSYIVPTRPVVPEVKNKGWVKTPIDAFILAKLEVAQHAHANVGMAPSPEADRATLVRRLSFDLIGLPPTPEEVQAALKDTSADWYEKVVDRLLASPHYGERMAVPWLDLVRFADTVGFHGDQNQRIFPYRDYVINAFNANMPFDQFTREQLAGDLLPNPTVEQRIATGFNRLNMMTREGGAQPREYLAKYAADRVRTVSGTWLGSTMGCAECHNHKYDPFTSKDFYSMSAFFSDVKQWGVYQDYGYTPNADLRGWSNDHPFPPELEVESPALIKRMELLKQRMDQVAGRVKPVEAEFTKWLDQVKEAKDGWVVPSVEASFGALAKPAPRKNTRTAPPKKADEKKSEKKDPAKPAEKKTPPPEPEVATVQPDGSVLIAGGIKDALNLALTVPAGWITTIRIELLPDAQHKKSILRNNAGNVTFKPTFFLRKGDDAKETPVAIRFADANLKEPIFRNGYDLLGVKDTWRTSAQNKSTAHISLWWLDQPQPVGEGEQLIVKFPTNLLGRVRVSVSPVAAALDCDWEKNPSAKLPQGELLYLRSTGWHGQAYAELKQLEQQYWECRGGKVHTQITEQMKPMVTRVLPRGNWLDENGEVVEPAVPGFMGSVRFVSQQRTQGADVPRSGESARLTRLDLANWLTSAENPLTARVFVNRLWKQFFGNGLSNIMEDLGAQGEWPTHPELLDWLAVEFRENGWNIKKIIKLIVMSNVYRQSAVVRTELKERDPNNRLLAAQNPRRLDAEFIRDLALFVSGLLNTELGGPSAFPYQPAGYYAQLQFPDRNYVPNRDDRQYRRGVYTHWQRTFLHPMMANFDAPAREECTACRTVANTPQQALTLLNDPSFVEAARVLAQNLIETEKSDEARLERAFWKVLSRGPKAKEKASLLKLLAGQREYFRSAPKEAVQMLQAGYFAASDKLDKVELAAWTGITRVLLNLHEAITRY